MRFVILLSFYLNLSVMGISFNRFSTPNIIKQTPSFSSIFHWRGGGVETKKEKKQTINKKNSKWVKKTSSPKKVEHTSLNENDEEPMLLQLTNETTSTSLSHNIIEMSDSLLSKYKLLQGDLICLRGKRRSSTLAVVKSSQR